MIDLSTMQSLSIPEGAVSQIEAGGRVIWSGVDKVVLEVKKITATIPRTDVEIEGAIHRNNCVRIASVSTRGSTAYLTYGGVTRKETNTSTFDRALCWTYWGNYYSVPKDTQVPDSGVLTIEGDYIGFRGYHTPDESREGESGELDNCITGVISFGRCTEICSETFYGSKLSCVRIPDQIRSIGYSAFAYCPNLKSVALPETPPELNSVSAFWQNHADRKFYVPSVSSYTAYLNATNWSSFAGSFIIGEPPEEV